MNSDVLRYQSEIARHRGAGSPDRTSCGFPAFESGYRPGKFGGALDVPDEEYEAFERKAIQEEAWSFGPPGAQALPGSVG